jgi:hypothetical protein
VERVPTNLPSSADDGDQEEVEEEDSSDVEEYSISDEAPPKKRRKGTRKLYDMRFGGSAYHQVGAIPAGGVGGAGPPPGMPDLREPCLENQIGMWTTEGFAPVRHPEEFLHTEYGSQKLYEGGLFALSGTELHNPWGYIDSIKRKHGVVGPPGTPLMMIGVPQGKDHLHTPEQLAALQGLPDSIRQKIKWLNKWFFTGTDAWGRYRCIDADAIKAISRLSPTVAFDVIEGLEEFGPEGLANPSSHVVFMARQATMKAASAAVMPVPGLGVLGPAIPMHRPGGKGNVVPRPPLGPPPQDVAMMAGSMGYGAAWAAGGASRDRGKKRSSRY